MMRRWMLAVALVTTACGGGESTVDPPPSTTGALTSTMTDAAAPQEIPPSTNADATPDQNGDEVLIYFSVEGGFANLGRTITITTDGTASVDANGRVSEGTLDTKTVSNIVDLLDRSALFDRDSTFAAEGADLQRYEIHYRGSTVVAYDSAIPDGLVEALALLDQTIRDVQTGS